MLVSYLGLLVAIGTGLVLTPVLLHHLGVGGFGLWSVLSTGASYLGILDAGVATTLVSRVARLRASGEHHELESVLASAKAFYLASSVAVGIVVSLVVPFLGRLLDLGHTGVGPAQLALLLLGGSTVATFVASSGASTLFGGGRGDRLGLLTLALNTASRLGQVAVAAAGGSLVGVVGVTTFASVVGALGVILLARQTFPELSAPLRLARWATLVDVLRSGRRNATVAISGAISFQLDTVVLGLILPIAMVTPYGIALRVTNLIRALATRGTDMLFPTLAHTHAKGDAERTFRVYSAALLATLAIALPAEVAVVALGPQLLRLWLGSVPSQTYVVLVALGAVFLLELPAHQSFVLLTAIERNRFLARVGPPVALLNLGLSVAATYRFGPVGPALGSLPQVVLLGAIGLPVLVCRVLGVPAGLLLRQVLLPVAALALGSGLAGLGMHMLLVGRPTLWALPGGLVVVLCGWSAAILPARKAQPELFAMARRRLRHR